MVTVLNVVIVHGNSTILAIASATIVLHVGHGAANSGATSRNGCVVGAGGGVKGLNGILDNLAGELAMGATLLRLYGEAAPKDKCYKCHQGAYQQYEVLDGRLLAQQHMID